MQENSLFLTFEYKKFKVVNLKIDILNFPSNASGMQTQACFKYTNAQTHMVYFQA